MIIPKLVLSLVQLSSVASMPLSWGKCLNDRQVGIRSGNPLIPSTASAILNGELSVLNHNIQDILLDDNDDWESNSFVRLVVDVKRIFSERKIDKKSANKS